MRSFLIFVFFAAALAIGAGAQTVTLPPATAAGQPMSWTNTCVAGETCLFNVYRLPGICPSTPGGTTGWTLLSPSPISAVSFLDTTAAPGSTDCWAISAVNSSGGAPAAPLVGSTTVPLLPTAPTGLTF